MIHKVRGIVLHHLNYGDTSIIAHLYTDQFGRQSIIVKGARGQRKNRKISLYHPLALLEMEIIYKENRDLQQLREAKPIVPLQGLMSDPIKSSVALFLAEVFYRTIRETEPNHALFEYLFSNIQLFDLMEDGISVYPLYILSQLTRFLGFRPNAPVEQGEFWLDMETGNFSISRPLRESRMDPSLSSHFIRLMHSSPDQLAGVKIGKKERQELLGKILEYYKLQLPGMSEIKSLSVLRSVFS